VEPVFTPLAATALTLVMVLATGFHAMRDEYAFMTLTLALSGILAFIAYGRLVRRPIEAGGITKKSLLTALAVIAAAFLLVVSTLPPGG
jgi:hypothetical protein